MHTVESLSRKVSSLKEQLISLSRQWEEREKELKVKEGQLRTLVRTSTPFTPRKIFTPVELRPSTPVLTASGKRGRDTWVEREVGGGSKRRTSLGNGIPFDPEGVRGRGVAVGLKIGGVLWDVGIGGVEAALEEGGFVVCERARWLVDEKEVDKRKKLGKTSSTVVVFVRGLDEAKGLMRRGLWLSGRWHSVRRFEAVQPTRKKSGWVWVREAVEGLVKTEQPEEKELRDKLEAYMEGVKRVMEKVDGEARQREIRRAERWVRHEGLKWTSEDERKEEEESDEDEDLKKLFGGVNFGSSGGLLSGFGGGAKKVVSGRAGEPTASSSTRGGMQREVGKESEKKWYCMACDSLAWSIKGKKPGCRFCNGTSRMVEKRYWVGPKD